MVFRFGHALSVSRGERKILIFLICSWATGTLHDLYYTGISYSTVQYYCSIFVFVCLFVCLFLFVTRPAQPQPKRKSEGKGIEGYAIRYRSSNLAHLASSQHWIVPRIPRIVRNTVLTGTWTSRKYVQTKGLSFKNL